MTEHYDHNTIEEKWQSRFEKEGLYRAEEDGDIPKEKRRYVLDMFPYPSSAGLHVGHPEGYTATDIYSRYLRMQGFSVLHPMGWDAFGLPAENFAIKQGIHPRRSTEKNIQTFRRQIKRLGFSYDWSREIDTSDPSYYRWTQWFFLFLYKRGLAYRAKAPVNWCPGCQTVLAREQVVDGQCERCNAEVIQKELQQWFFKITDYASRLLSDLEHIDWPLPIKLMQKNWIGESYGITIRFPIVDAKDELSVFTKFPETIFGVSFMAVAPEHSLIEKYKSKITNYKEVVQYIEKSSRKTELQRTDLAKEKTGIPLKGIMARNPVNNEEIPIWVADYVLMSYGSGAVMGVPGHDMRDFEFAKQFSLPVARVMCLGGGGDDSPITTSAQVIEEGIMVNSDFLNGLDARVEAKEKIKDYLEERGFGARSVQYRLRDWLISRQRYWGAPIPIIYCDVCGEVPVPENDLPVVLPDVVDFLPTGESPLARSQSFHSVLCPSCGASARRESDTMDTFVCSSWYLYRYTDPKNEAEFASRHNLAHWLPVDLYVGGAEHAVMHLLYARFFCKVLFDAGYIFFNEPFAKLLNQGMILAEDGRKMSKRYGNVINPDDVVVEYGADTMRMYEMFMGPLEDPKPWSTEGIRGIRRFLDKAWRVFGEMGDSKNDKRLSLRGAPYSERRSNLISILHQTIKKVTKDIENFKFNTAIAQMMIFLNHFSSMRTWLSNEEFLKARDSFLLLLSPFAPHLSQEIWEIAGKRGFIARERWPIFDPSLAQDKQIKIAVQVNGKLRGMLETSDDMKESDVVSLAKKDEKVSLHLKGTVVKHIYVPGKVINFVVRE